MTEGFGWGWVLVLPEAAASGAGFGFGFRVGGIGVVFLVVPRHSRFEHFKVDVASIDEDRSEDASVTVALGVGYAHFAVRNEAGKELPRGVSKCLFLLRRVDALQSDFVLRGGCGKHGDRVAVRNTNNTPDDLLREEREREQQEQCL